MKQYIVISILIFLVILFVIVTIVVVVNNNDDEDMAYRVGNVIDCSFASRYGSVHAVRFLDKFRKNVSAWETESICSRMISIGSRLPISSSVTISSRKQIAACKWWSIYEYKNISCVLQDWKKFISSTIGEQMVEYKNLHIDSDNHENTLFVHARVGDFIRLGNGIPSADSMVQAALSLDKPFTHINLLNGGIHHSLAKSEPAYDTSITYLTLLSNLLQKAFPSCKRVNDFDSGSADGDWMALATSRHLICGVGSFGVSAAIASAGNVRSPAVKNINFAREGILSEDHISNRWHTYACDVIHESQY